MAPWNSSSNRRRDVHVLFGGSMCSQSCANGIIFNQGLFRIALKTELMYVMRKLLSRQWMSSYLLRSSVASGCWKNASYRTNLKIEFLSWYVESIHRLYLSSSSLRTSPVPVYFRSESEPPCISGYRQDAGHNAWGLVPVGSGCCRSIAGLVPKDRPAYIDEQ